MEFLQNIEPREYQLKILETCVKKNCLVVLPTGLGKTLIALMLVIKRMKEFPGERAVFLAPTKPLAEQHLNSFKKQLPELFGDMQLFTGEVKPEERKKIWQTADIIFSTPQCVANDLKKNLYNLSNVCLLIEDEAHRCIKNYDYNYVSQEYQKQSLHPRILGLTASPGNDVSRIKEICKNLSIEEVELRTRDSDDVKKYLQELKFEKILVDLPVEFEEIKHLLTKLLNEYVEELRYRSVLFGPANKISLLELQKKISRALSMGNKNYNYMLGASACAQAIKIQHALELLETQTLESFNKYLKNLLEQASKKQSKGVVKLVARSEFNFIFMQSNELLAKNHEHPKLNEANKIIKKEIELNPAVKIIIFTQFRDTANILSKNLNEINGINAKVFIGQASKAGEKGLNQKEQKQIIQEFSEGKINILCATCIGEEGLDIPEVNAVIFYEPVASAIRTIQRSGRTARLNKGKIIMLITKKTRDESSFYVSRAREKKMKIAIEEIRGSLAKTFEMQKKLGE
ncbi:MAG: DEAD/DEAH box helicase [Nanoarchaeota archaeon]